LIVMLLFGASRLPKLARSMGQAGKEFKEGMRDGAREEAPVQGPCPFCATEIPAEASFCPGCARSKEEVIVQRAAAVSRSA